MNRRTIALILALTVTLALGASAATAESAAPKTAETDPAAAETAAPDTKREETVFAAAESAAGTETAAPDAAGTLSFGNIGPRMIANYYPLLALQESIDDVEGHDYEARLENLRRRINEASAGQWGMYSLYSAMGQGMLGSMMLQSTQSGVDTLRRQFDDVQDGTAQKNDADKLREYRSAQNAAVMGGESLYIQILGYQAQDAAATRGLAKLDRAIRELELRRELGQVSELTVSQLRNTRTQTASQQQTLRTGIDAMLLTLKGMVGAELGEPLTLEALPKVTAEQLEAMDLDADLARAKENSYALYDAKKQIDDFRKGTYKDVTGQLGTSDKIFEVSQVKHALKALQLNYEDKAQSFELNFRTLYAQVGDAAQTLSAKRAALAQQEKEYAASALKFEQGNISANALADAKDALADAKDAVTGAERDLFSKYRTYTWAVDCGILNG